MGGPPEFALGDNEEFMGRLLERSMAWTRETGHVAMKSLEAVLPNNGENTKKSLAIRTAAEFVV